MPPTPRSIALRRVSIFDKLDAATLDVLANSCRFTEYAAGADILSYLDPSTDVYFLLSGKVQVVIHAVNGRAVVFLDLAPGQMFGELAAIDGKPRSASVTALDATSIASMPARAFKTLVETQPSVAQALILKLAQDLRRTGERVVEFSTMSVAERVQSELLRQADGASVANADTVVLSPAPSLADLASRVSTHREAVSRELSHLGQLGFIRREGSDLRVLSRAKLRTLVDQARGD